jgi:hypothetical protein
MGVVGHDAFRSSVFVGFPGGFLRNELNVGLSGNDCDGG